MAGVEQAYTFAETDRVDIRRFCGFPPYGTGVVVFPEPWVFRYYLAMETRLNNLVPAEAAVVLRYLADLWTLESAIPAAGQNLPAKRAQYGHRSAAESLDTPN